MSLHFALIVLLTVVFVVLIVPVGIKIAIASGFVDHPGGRKKHDIAVPPAGGLMIFPVFIIVSALMGFAGSLWPLYCGMFVLLLAGGLDDKSHIAPRYKFIAQFVATFFIVLFGAARLTSLSDIFGFGPLGLALMSIPFSVIATVLLINAINLLDGLDGLAGGIGFVVFGWLGVAALVAGNDIALMQIVLLLAVLSGFLWFNLRHVFRSGAVVFLGDAGSLTLGLLIAWYTMSLGNGVRGIVEPISVAWLLALPIYDTCAQFARRIGEGRHPFDADHDHFHHQLLKIGLSPARATWFVLLICVVCGAIGIGSVWAGLPPFVLTYLWIAGLFAHMYLSYKPARYRAVLNKLLFIKSA